VNPFEQHSYFIQGKSIANPSVSSVQPCDAPISNIEYRCCCHIDNILWRLRKHTKERFWLFLVVDSVPDAFAYSEKRKGIGEIRLTTGLLTGLAILAARVAIIQADSQIFDQHWLPSFYARLYGNSDFDGFSTFDLNLTKVNATGLDRHGIHELNLRLLTDSSVFVNTIKLASAAIEFAVFHEIGHFDAGHDEAGRLQRHLKKTMGVKLPSEFQSSLDVQRIFEHQADIFALRLMLTLAPSRPVLGDIESHQFGNSELRLETNICSYIGMSLNLALATLMRTDDPPPGEEIKLLSKPMGEHPLHTTRLTIADAAIRNELANPKARKIIWPDGPEMSEIILAGMAFHTLSLALASVSKSWNTKATFMLLDRMAPDAEFDFTDRADLEKSLTYLHADNERKVRFRLLAIGLGGPRHWIDQLRIGLRIIWKRIS
jgi:hypothetical protein